MKKILVSVMIVFVVIISFIYFKSDRKEESIVKYNGSNLMVSVDGVNNDKLPKSGNYYLASYTCQNKNTVVKWDRNKHELYVSNGNNKGSISCYLEFETNPKLSMMDIGSYVKYVGNNGCNGDSCLGKNEYCGSKDYKYFKDGYRIAYIGDNTVYLVSAGALECSDNVDKISDIALKYCNRNFVLGGVCNNTVSWGFNSMDFKMITKNSITDTTCNNSSSDVACGYNNDLVDVGGNYYILVNGKGYGWNANNRYVSDKVEGSYGVRPVIRIDNNVFVTDGDGSYDNPYVISNNTFFVNNGSTVISKDKDKVKLSLIGRDVSRMCISVNTSVCDNYIDFKDSYILDLSKEDKGEKLIYVYYKDGRDRIIASINRSITLE